MPDPTPERIEAALALAEADEFHYRHKDNKAAHDAHMAALEAYRATAPKPLRTRAELDSSLAARVLMWFMHTGGRFMGDATRVELADLCRERIAPDSGPSSEPDRPPPVAAAGAAYSPIGWERRSRGWRHSRGFWVFQRSDGGIELQYDPDDEHVVIPACDVGTIFGPRPTPATKESSDTAGVEAGVANYVCVDCGLFSDREPSIAKRMDNRYRCNDCANKPDPNRLTDHDSDQREAEACSCEESEALKARIEAILSHVIIVNGTSYRVRDLLAVQPLVKEALR